MSETAARNLNNFAEFSDLSKRDDTGLLVVLTSNDERNRLLSRLVAHTLANNPNDLTDLYLVLPGSGGIIDIRDHCLQEYPNSGFGKAGAVIVDETYNDAFLPKETYGQLATLARELEIKVVLLADTLNATVEEDANLVVRVTAGEDSTHSLGVVKNRNGETGSIEFVYEEQENINDEDQDED